MKDLTLTWNRLRKLQNDILCLSTYERSKFNTVTLFHKDNFVGIRIQDYSLGSDVLELCFKAFRGALYFVERDPYSSDRYSFIISVNERYLK